MSDIAIQLQEILEIHKDRPKDAKAKLKRLERIINPSDSITTEFFYFYGDCELSVRVREAARATNRENILAAIEAVAQEKSDTEKIEELVAMKFKEAPKKKRSKVEALNAH